MLQPIVNQQVSHVLAALEREVEAGSGESGSASESGGTAGVPASTEAGTELAPELKDSGPAGRRRRGD